MNPTSPSSKTKPSRREFLKTSSALFAAATMAGGSARSVHAAGSDTIKIALVGCGGRGGGAAVDAMTACANVKLVAMADAFKGPLEGSLQALKARFGDRVDVPADRQFVGLDAYQKAIDCGVDMVLLCSPPGFRPAHFEAAVKAGKQIFMEKPVAVDAPGVRRVLAANAEAKKKGLMVAVGHHLRHETKHKEIIRRMQDGAIGDILFMRVYFNSGGVWVRPRRPGQSELEYQVQNWYYFNWLSGDHIVEQHVHDLDVINWLKNGPPVQANGMGGRQVRIGKDYGEIFDHHAVEFDYADGSKLFSYCRHIPNCWESFSEHAHGTKGRAEIEGHGTSVLRVNGQKPMSWKRDRDGHLIEHEDLFAALLAGKPYNEGDYGATSSMTAILGRMASYSGKIVTWDEAIKSELSLGPKELAFEAEAPVQPGKDGIYACAVPGVTKAW
jgi:myo-inositol 2-dehydrogenase / D-chiro-inositol 1-dehydrogenase